MVQQPTQTFTQSKLDVFIPALCKDNVKETACEDVDWSRRIQDRDQWWAFMNMAINFRVPKNTGIS
jgi:hypothetical protein